MKVLVTDNLTNLTHTIDVPVVAGKTIVPNQPPTDSERIDALIAENVALKARLAKIEAVPIVKATLEPVIIK